MRGDRDVSDGIALAGVIGSPIAHSRSPCLHGHWLSRYAIAGHYVPLEVAPKDLADVLRALPRMGFRGVNATIPHKEAALALADRATERAARIGAANTLTFDADGALQADNTDGYGFIENLRQSEPGWDAAAGPAAVFGAGGAARAVVASLLDAGAPELRIANRSRERAQALRDTFGPAVTVVDWDDADALVADAATVVNTTSRGMTGQPALRLPAAKLAPGALVTDLVYTPLQTPFLADAAGRGLRTVDGLGMLLHQAVPGFEAWFGRRPEVDPALRQAVIAP